MDMKGNSEPPQGFDERGDTVRAAGEKNEFGSRMRDWLQGSHAGSREAGEEWVVIIGLGT